MLIRTLKGFNRNRIVNLKQVYSDPLIKMKKYADAYTMLGPGIDKNGLPVTGLTENRVDIVKGKEVTIPGTRIIMERMLDMKEGSLKQSSAYWLAFNIRLGSDPEQLDLQDPHQLLKYLFASAQSIVADGFKQIQEDSRIEYVLYSEEQEAAVRVSERRTLRDAYVLADKLDITTKANVLNVYGIIVDGSDVNTIEDKIGEKIEEDPIKFLDLVKDEDLVYKSLVTKCLDKGILVMKNGAVVHGEVNVGYDKDSAAKAISKNNTLEAILKAKLSGDMDLISKALNDSKE